jgi:hypothetical protein
VTAARLSFLNVDSFTADEAPPPPPVFTPLPARSPFLSVYETDGEDPASVPLREAFATLVDRLHDDEFEESLAAVHADGRAFHDAQLAAGVSREQADRRLHQYFEPLMRETAAMVDAIGARFVPQEASGLVDHEVRSFVEGYAPREPLAPAFENLFGSLFKKVGGLVSSVAGKALSGLQHLALGPFLKLLKPRLLGFLKAIAARVIGRLPAPVQPAARLLARRLGLPLADPAPTGEAVPSSGESSDESADEVDALSQQFLDEQLAGTVFARDDGEVEYEAAAYGAAATETPVYAELEDARERFIEALPALKEGESPAPALEQFLPALMPAMRIASKVIGKHRFVRVIAKVLTPLIARLIDPAQAEPLSRAIADAGLSLLGMEVPEGEQQQLAPPAIAATVEETMSRLADLPGEMLDNDELLEAFTLESFEAAAAANLPALFSSEVYQRRPELLEGGVEAPWVMMPLLRGPRRYKRCARAFAVRLSPYMAAEVETFEGAPLADFVQDQLGVDDAGELEAELHLYEALPGTTLADIARGERETLGPGYADEVNMEQLQPLTRRAAAVLLGRPGLGRYWRPASRYRPLRGGERFYALRLPNAARVGRRRRPLHVRLVLDAVRDEARVCVFLSEAKAQRLAVRLRQQGHAGAIAASFDRWIAPRLVHLLTGHARHRLRIVHAGTQPGQTPAMQAQRLAPSMARPFAEQLRGWLVQGFTDAMKTQLPQIIAAIEHPSQGVTLRFVIDKPAGLKALADGAVGAAATASAAAASGAPAPMPATVPDAAPAAEPAAASAAAHDAVPAAAAVPATAPEPAHEAALAPNVRVQVSPGHRCA